MATEVIGNPKERELSRSEEEERLLREIREEKERLWVEISVRWRREHNNTDSLNLFVMSIQFIGATTPDYRHRQRASCP